MIKQELPPGLEKLRPQTSLLKKLILKFELSLVSVLQGPKQSQSLILHVGCNTTDKKQECQTLGVLLGLVSLKKIKNVEGRLAEESLNVWLHKACKVHAYSFRKEHFKFSLLMFWQ